MTTLDLLDETKAAELLGVEPRTLRLWRNTRGLPHFKPTGKIVRYRASEIMNWLERFRVATRGVR